MPATKRIRRTPEQAKRALLDAAAARLAEHGVHGLGVTEVAKAAGMTHTTLLHHFGSAAGMHRALAADMTRQLIADVLENLAANRGKGLDAVCAGLFNTVRMPGHVAMIAWTSINHGLQPVAEGDPRLEVFEQLVDLLAEELQTDRLRTQRLLYLIISTAIGNALSGQVAAGLLGLPEDTPTQFPDWLSNRIRLFLEQTN